MYVFLDTMTENICHLKKNEAFFVCNWEISIDALRLESRDVSRLNLTENNMIRSKKVLSRPN